MQPRDDIPGVRDDVDRFVGRDRYRRGDRQELQGVDVDGFRPQRLHPRARKGAWRVLGHRPIGDYLGRNHGVPSPFPLKGSVRKHRDGVRTRGTGGQRGRRSHVLDEREGLLLQEGTVPAYYRAIRVAGPDLPQPFVPSGRVRRLAGEVLPR